MYHHNTVHDKGILMGVEHQTCKSLLMITHENLLKAKRYTKTYKQNMTIFTEKYGLDGVRQNIPVMPEIILFKMVLSN